MALRGMRSLGAGQGRGQFEVLLVLARDPAAAGRDVGQRQAVDGAEAAHQDREIEDLGRHDLGAQLGHIGLDLENTDRLAIGGADRGPVDQGGGKSGVVVLAERGEDLGQGRRL